MGAMEKVSAIIIQEHGEPQLVAKPGECELPELGEDEARVRVLYSPINPADINVLEGKYPVRPKLPGVPGVEGVGIVEAVGCSVSHVSAGMHVLLPAGMGAWRERGNANAAELVVVPDGVPLEQAAMLRINPPTALRMLEDFVELHSGNWVIQNAANSGVGRAVIQIAKAKGIKTLNVVRRAELVDELKSIGANEVILDDASVKETAQGFTAGAGVKLALNAVGGDSALRLASVLQDGGTIVTYGAMGRQPLRIPNGLLIFQDIAWRGFWVTRWYKQASALEKQDMFSELFDLAKCGKLHTPVDAIYPLESGAEAIAHAMKGGRNGKILLKCSA